MTRTKVKLFKTKEILLPAYDKLWLEEYILYRQYQKISSDCQLKLQATVTLLMGMRMHYCIYANCNL